MAGRYFWDWPLRLCGPLPLPRLGLLWPMRRRSIHYLHGF